MPLDVVTFGEAMVLPGIDEVKLLTGHDSPQGIANFYLDTGVSQVVVKLGSERA